MTRTVELLWFSECPNHAAARRLLDDVVRDLAPGTPVREIDASDPTTAARLRFPGSPTIRIDGQDVDPSYVDRGDYAPGCRLYRTSDGLRGLPPRSWIEDALLSPSMTGVATMPSGAHPWVRRAVGGGEEAGR